MGVLDEEYDYKTEALATLLLRSGGHFTVDEFRCKCCGKIHMNEDFIIKLCKIRKELGLPITLSSAYRCPEHPEEAKKKGAYWQGHVEGRAIDVKYQAKSYRAKLIRIAYRHGMKGIGISNSFVHLDDRNWDALYFYKGFKG